MGGWASRTRNDREEVVVKRQSYRYAHMSFPTVTNYARNRNNAGYNSLPYSRQKPTDVTL